MKALVTIAALLLSATGATAGGLQNLARTSVGNALSGSFSTETRVITFGQSAALFNKQSASSFAGSQGNLNQSIGILAPGETNIVVINNAVNSVPMEGMPSANLSAYTQVNGNIPANGMTGVSNLSTFTNFKTAGSENTSLTQSELEQYRSTAVIQNYSLINELFNEAQTLAQSLF